MRSSYVQVQVGWSSLLQSPLSLQVVSWPGTPALYSQMQGPESKTGSKKLSASQKAVFRPSLLKQYDRRCCCTFNHFDPIIDNNSQKQCNVASDNVFSVTLLMHYIRMHFCFDTRCAYVDAQLTLLSSGASPQCCSLPQEFHQQCCKQLDESLFVSPDYHVCPSAIMDCMTALDGL